MRFLGSILAVMLVPWGCCQDVNSEDVKGAVNRAFHWAIEEEGLPDSSFLTSNGRIRVLESGIERSWLSPPPGLHLEFVNEEEIEALAEEEGAFLYMAFSDVTVQPGEFVELVVSTRWSTAPGSRSLRLSGGSVKLRLERSFCRWVIEEQYRVVS